MDIHKPKPWHGLREFLKEYVIIVVGVLTALAAEQGVEWLHTQAELAEARDALRAELSADAVTLGFSAKEDRCFLAGLERFGAWAKGGPKPPPVVEGVKLPNLRATVWDEVKSGAVLHMPLKERLDYARFYGDVGNHTLLVAGERSLAGQIAQLTATDTLDAQDAKALRQTAVGSRTFLRIKMGQDVGMLQEALALGAKPKPLSAVNRGYLETLCGMAGVPVTD